MDFIKLEELAKRNLSEYRYHHTMAVAKLAEELAIHYGISKEDARIAALLHDLTKEENAQEQLQKIKKSDIMTDKAFVENETLYHSVTAYLYAKNELVIKNKDILNAILYHTTARENMSLLEKIIYVADKVSYDRTYDDVLVYRELSFKDIDECVLKIVDFVIKSLINKRQAIALDTVKCYNSILNGKKGS